MKTYCANTRHLYTKSKEDRIYLISDCVISGHGKSRFFIPNQVIVQFVVKNAPPHKILCHKSLDF